MAQKDEISFENAFEIVNQIVKDMESGTLALNDLVEKYAEGSRYLKICEKQLKRAELKIEQIKEANGILQTESCDL